MVEMGTELLRTPKQCPRSPSKKNTMLTVDHLRTTLFSQTGMNLTHPAASQGVRPSIGDAGHLCALAHQLSRSEWKYNNKVSS